MKLMNEKFASREEPAPAAFLLRELPDGTWEPVPLAGNRFGLYDAPGKPLTIGLAPLKSENAKPLGLLLGMRRGAAGTQRDWVLLIKPGAPLEINGDHEHASIGFKELRDHDVLVVRGRQRLVFSSGREPLTTFLRNVNQDRLAC